MLTRNHGVDCLRQFHRVGRYCYHCAAFHPLLLQQSFWRFENVQNFLLYPHLLVLGLWYCRSLLGVIFLRTSQQIMGHYRNRIRALRCKQALLRLHWYHSCFLRPCNCVTPDADDMAPENGPTQQDDSFRVAMPGTCVSHRLRPLDSQSTSLGNR